jgi:hypothetical protein
MLQRGGPGGIVDVIEFFDDGSKITLLDSSIAVKLGLKGIPTLFCCNWTSNVTRQDERSEKVMLEILQNLETNNCFVMKNVRTMTDLDLPTQKINVENLVQNYPYIKKAKLEGLNGIKPFIPSTQSTRSYTSKTEL